MFRFREHRGGLGASMKTQVELKDRAALASHCRKLLKPLGIRFADGDLTIGLYNANPDFRIGWAQTFVVTIAGYGIVGFTDRLPGG